jgi:hypothetical protein
LREPGKGFGHRHARHEGIGGKPPHLREAGIAEHEPALVIEQGEPLMHAFERVITPGALRREAFLIGLEAGHVAHDAGKADDMASGVEDALDRNMGPICRAIAAQAIALAEIVPGGARHRQHALGQAFGPVFEAIEPRQRHAERLLVVIALDAPGPGIPACHPPLEREHDQGAIGQPPHHQRQITLARGQYPTPHRQNTRPQHAGKRNARKGTAQDHARTDNAGHDQRQCQDEDQHCEHRAASPVQARWPWDGRATGGLRKHDFAID